MRELLRLHTHPRDEAGGSAVEYGLLVAGVTALVVAAVFLLGGLVKDLFQSTCTDLKQASSSAAGTC